MYTRVREKSLTICRSSRVEQTSDLKSVGAITSNLGVRIPSPIPRTQRRQEMVSMWIAGIGIAATALIAYTLGHHASTKKWQDELCERVNQMVDAKIEEVGQLYNETYRNVLRHLFEIVDEVERKDDAE